MSDTLSCPDYVADLEQLIERPSGATELLPPQPLSWEACSRHSLPHRKAHIRTARVRCRYTTKTECQPRPKIESPVQGSVTG